MLQIKKVDRAAWFCLKCGHKLQNSHDFLNQIVSLTIRAAVPRYRLAAGGRSPKKLRIMISYGMPPEKPRIGSKHKHDKGRF
jgi:hypothetical protein